MMTTQKPVDSSTNGRQPSSTGPSSTSGDDKPSGNGERDHFANLGEQGRIANLREAAYFLPFLKPSRMLIVAILACTLAAELLVLPATFLPQQFVAHWDNRAWLTIFLVFSAVAAISAGLVRLVEGYCANRLDERLAHDLRLKLFGKIEHLSMLSVMSRGVGPFVQRIVRDVDQIRDLFRFVLLELVTESVRLVIILSVMLWIEPLLTVILIPLFLAVGPLVRRANRRVENLAGEIQSLGEDSVDHMVEAVGGFRDIQVAGRFDRFFARFAEVSRQTEKAGVRVGFYANLAASYPTVTAGILVTVPYFLSLRTLTSVEDVGRVISYVILLRQALPGFTFLARSTSLLARSLPALREVRDVLESENEHGDDECVNAPQSVIETSNEPLAESIRFENVGIRLGGRWILRDLNFEIPVGKRTAIVGENGAGKSTIFGMLLRLLRPTEGTIWIDDRRLDDIPLAELRKLVGFIPQNPFIFNQSLRDNLLMGADDDSDQNARMAEVIELAQLEEMIEKRATEGGLDAVAGHMGARLSGGERQRIALGRLLLQEPEVVVCDEHTANIDAKSARVIDETINEHFENRTRIVITHSLPAITDADSIIVVDNGTISAQGTHAELVTTDGLYRDLWEAQTGARTAELV